MATSDESIKAALKKSMMQLMEHGVSDTGIALREQAKSLEREIENESAKSEKDERKIATLKVAIDGISGVIFTLEQDLLVSVAQTIADIGNSLALPLGIVTDDDILKPKKSRQRKASSSAIVTVNPERAKLIIDACGSDGKTITQLEKTTKLKGMTLRKAVKSLADAGKLKSKDGTKTGRGIAPKIYFT